MLARILAHKVEEVADRRRRLALPSEAELQSLPRSRGFAASLERRIAETGTAVIAECKRASPSKGLLREPYEPVAIASGYAEAGAAAISVLTDIAFFQGADLHLQAVRAAVPLPVLRKDFVVDAWQVRETRWLGADCLLLIVAALDDARLRDFLQLARGLGLDVLVEVHDEAERDRALAVGASLLGINNRDLKRFVTDLAVSERVAAGVPAGIRVVSESGIGSREDLQRLRRAGIAAFLVGESLVRAENPGAALAALLAG